MEKLKLYTVTKSSSDGYIKIGDMIWLSENGDLNSCQGMGFLTEDEWNNLKRNDFEVEECKTHYLDVINGHEQVRKIQ